MEKWLCLATIAVSGLVFLIFAMDLAIGLPFGGLSPLVDILSIVAAGMVAYLGWETYLEQR